MAENDVNAEVEVVEVAAKKKKKLSKTIEGHVLTIIESITNTTLTYNADDLPEAIQDSLMPYGLSQKLGDAAAGKKGEEAVESINKVWDGLVAGNWKVRAPAAKQISEKSIMDKYNDMPAGKEKIVFKGLLEKLGMVVPN